MRTGHVAVIGKPNVGKSTLINAVVGQKIAAVSPRPQTTRHRQLGIFTTRDVQIIFVDTPGLHDPRHRLGQYLNQEAREALKQVNAVLWLVDASRDLDGEDLKIASLIGSLNGKPALVIGLNKIDLVDSRVMESRETACKAALPNVPVFPISSTSGQGLPELLNELNTHMPSGEPQFPGEQVTDLYEREIACELIREAALSILRDEVPHCLAVRLDEYKERREGNAYVHATLFVEKETQKGIVIGEGGRMLKQIGMMARKEIEQMSGRNVYLELRVKVEKNWRNNEHALRQFGYRIKRR